MAKIDVKDIGCRHSGTNAYQHTRKNWGYRLVEPPVVDSLSAISQVPDKEDTMIVGGTAISMYCYEKMPYEKTRQTDDIDVKYKKRLTKNDFKQGFGKNISNVLKEYGYHPKMHPNSHKNHAVVVLPQDEYTEAFYVCTPRMSNGYWKSKERILMKEFENIQDKKIPGGKNKEVQVAGLEDVIAPKVILFRDKDRLDIDTALKYGPKLDRKRLDNMIHMWCDLFKENPDDYMKKFDKIRQEA